MSVLKTEKRIKKLIEFLKNEFKHGIQMFNSPSLSGDEREIIYNQDGIVVLHSYYYEYIEIYGISTKEFKKVMKKSGGY